ncbi:hypothetical protein [Dasania marina]|uniref:hypothetical protein n=1 Tax=Dasania marina TaxID=471499 RepID=UPI000382CC67|nr:hypothetical protein [Dasania marina]
MILLSKQTALSYYLGIAVFTMDWAFSWPYFLSIQANLDHTGTVVVAGQFSNLVGNSAGAALAAFLVGSANYNSAIYLAIGLSCLSLLLILSAPLLKRLTTKQL